MIFFSSKKHEHTAGEVVLIFDVGSNSVGGALSLISSRHKPVLLATTRTVFPFQGMPSAMRMRSLMLRSVSETTLSLLAEGLPRAGLSAKHLKVADVLYVLKSPWCVSRAKTLSITQKEPIQITEDVIGGLVQHEDELDERHKENPEKAHAHFHAASERFEWLLISSSLNGYKTNSPIGKETREASFSFFESRAPRALLRKIVDSVSHFVHPRRERFHSYALASFSVLRELFPDTNDFLIINIDGEITEVLVVKNGILLEVLTFPCGYNQLIRALCDKIGCSPAASSGLLALAGERRLNASKGQKVISILDSFRDIWFSSLARTLYHFSGETFLPPFIYMTADDDCTETFADFIRSAGEDMFKIWSTVPTVKTLSGEILRAGFTIDAFASASDPFLTLESAYASQVARRGQLFA